jgi:hypothetical protein
MLREWEEATTVAWYLSVSFYIYIFFLLLSNSVITVYSNLLIVSCFPQEIVSIDNVVGGGGEGNGGGGGGKTMAVAEDKATAVAEEATMAAE